MPVKRFVAYEYDGIGRANAWNNKESIFRARKGRVRFYCNTKAIAERLMTTTISATRKHMGELVKYFLRLGLLGFGGPVALVGHMERELVTERKWLTKEQMREAIAICQSLPGPLAIQVGIYISYLRGGFWGAWAGGWAFILPNFVIVAGLSALYVYLGDLQPVTAVFYGVSPAVIALILHSCYRNSYDASKTPPPPAHAIPHVRGP
jgi:chromate transport protein ChrA